MLSLTRDSSSVPRRIGFSIQVVPPGCYRRGRSKPGDSSHWLCHIGASTSAKPPGCNRHGRSNPRNISHGLSLNDLWKFMRISADDWAEERPWAPTLVVGNANKGK